MTYYIVIASLFCTTSDEEQHSWVRQFVSDNQAVSILYKTYAERHVWWCERSVNMKIGDKHL